MGAGHPDGSTVEGCRLEAAYRRLDEGRLLQALQLAREALHEAVGRKDHLRHAQALLCIAHADRLGSRFRRAHASAASSMQLFRTIGDPAGEASALSILAHTATCLGRNEEAVEAALLSVKLGEAAAASDLQQATLHNYLGIAYLWSKSFAKAEHTLQTAYRLALDSERPASAFQPMCNLLWCAAVRRVWERAREGHSLSLSAMVEAEANCARLLGDDGLGGLFGGNSVTANALWRLARALLRVWQGRLDEADALMNDACSWIATYDTNTWLSSFEHWVRVERALAVDDLDGAADAARILIDVASQNEYEQLLCLGHLLLSHAEERRGRWREAAVSLKRLQRKEEAIRAEALASREQVVQWHLELRRSEDSVKRLTTASALLERLAFEDPLTGIPNRRHFEQALGHALAAGQAHPHPLCVAFVDIDKFKAVNDRHSHQVGDEVLKAIATIVRTQLRGGDFAARLAGDEFGIFLRNATRAGAEQAIERIRHKIGTHPWHQLAPGLSVRVSVGIAEATNDDTVASLLDRSDREMYRRKA